MKDEQIIELYWKRDEAAIAASSEQYGGYCFAIANNVLNDRQDADECVNDTWLRAWRAIPPQRPGRLSAFFGRITRNLAFDRFQANHAQKRGGGEFAVVLDELADCIPAAGGVEEHVLLSELSRAVSSFLYELPVRDCNLFLRRYWYGEPIRTLAKRFAMKETSVKASLHRTRGKLRTYLEKEGLS